MCVISVIFNVLGIKTEEFKKSVFIKDDIIFIFLERTALQEIKRNLKGYFEEIKERIYTCHHGWVPRCLYLEVLTDGTVIHPLHESKAFIKERTPQKLILEWELYGQETFVFNNRAYELN